MGTQSLVEARYRGNAVGPDGEPSNPFTQSELPDIDVEEDFKTINARNNQLVRIFYHFFFHLLFRRFAFV